MPKSDCGKRIRDALTFVGDEHAGMATGGSMSTYNLADAFVAFATLRGDRPALVSGSRELTFAQLAATSAQIANALSSSGIRPGDNVGLALRDGMDTMLYLVALWMLDAVGVVLDFRAPTQERDIFVDEFDLVRVVADNRPPASPDWAMAIAGDWQKEVDRHPTTPPIRTGGGNGIATISTTSGTTGRPLGLLMRHDDVFLRVAHNVNRYVRGSGTFLLPLSMHFGAARNSVIDKLVQGWTVVIYPPLYSSAELAEDLIRLAPQGTFIVPTVLRGLLQYARGKQGPLFPSLTEFICAGSPALPHEKRAAVELLSPVFSDEYGSSFCSGITWLSGPEIAAHADTVGRPAPMVRLEIVDDQDSVVPTGTAGHIRCRTPSMVIGTYRDRMRTTGDRIKDGWVYPGDIGMINADGYLRILGRSTDVIIRGGSNVHPVEIETVLATCPGVRAVAVTGYVTEREGEEIAAVVVADRTVTEASLIAFARSQLPPDKRPRKFLFVKAVPQTNIGKPDRKAIRLLVNGIDE